MTPSRALQQLRRWEESGGTWEVLHRRGDQVEVALKRCDGGEIADRLASNDPDVLAYVELPRLAADDQ